MKNFILLFYKILNIGIDQKTPEPQFVRSSNMAALIAMFVAVPYIFIYFIIDNTYMCLVNFSFFILYSSILFINKKNFYLLAKMMIIVFGYAHVSMVSVYYGPSTGFELYFYLMPIISIFVFSIKEQKFMLYGLFLFFIFFFLTQYLYTIFTPVDLDQNIVKLLYYSSVVLILVFIMSFVYYFRTSSLHLQKDLQAQKELAEHANESKSLFLANMSHEIRTPMNAILGFIKLLKDRSNDEKSTQYLEIIDTSSKSLLNIIEDILDFSKIDSGKLKIDKIDFDAPLELSTIVHLFDAKCNQEQISLVLKLSQDLPQYLNTDPYRLKQVLSNLLSNAVKFTKPHKKITVWIYYKNKALHVHVKDEGKGIAKEKQKEIFKAFGQEDNSTTRKYGGTGLGLSISAQLIQLLGGELKLKSELGKGSEFYFSIPVEIASKVQNNNPKTTDNTPLKGHILLVEDNKTNQLFMTILLKNLNLTFDIANDGLEAVEMFKHHNYDAILMDENMPNMSGIEATKIILNEEMQRSLTHTPIIALTANAIEGERDKFIGAGMDEYLTKPIDENKLTSVLKSFIS